MKLTNKDLRDHVATACGMTNKAKTRIFQGFHRLDCECEDCRRFTNKAKTVCEGGEKVNSGDVCVPAPESHFPSIESQQDYWKVRDKELDRIESCCQWFHELDNQQGERPF